MESFEGVLKGLLTARILLLRYASGGSAHLKNIETSSSGGGTVCEGAFLFKVLEITVEG